MSGTKRTHSVKDIDRQRRRIAAMSDAELYSAQLSTLMQIFDDPNTTPAKRAGVDWEFTQLVADLRNQADALLGEDVVSLAIERAHIGEASPAASCWQLQILIGVSLLLEARALFIDMTNQQRTLH